MRAMVLSKVDGLKRPIENVDFLKIFISGHYLINCSKSSFFKSVDSEQKLTIATLAL